MSYVKALFSLLMLLCAFFTFADPVINDHFKHESINTVRYSFEPTSLLSATQSDFNNWQQ